MSFPYLPWVWERHGPWLVAVTLTLVIWLLNCWVDGVDIKFPEQDDIKFLLGASITSGAIFTSFLGTSLSFLSGVKTPAYYIVRETGYNNLLLAYFREAILGSLGFSLLSLSGYFVNKHNDIYFYAWVAVGTFAVFSFWRCVKLLFKILRVKKPKY